MENIQIDFYASSGNIPDIVSAPVPVDDRIRGMRWFTSINDEVQKEILSYGKDGEVEVYEAIFPSGCIDQETTFLATINTYDPDPAEIPVPIWAGATVAAQRIKNRLQIVINSGGTDFTADHSHHLNEPEEVLKSGEWLYQTKQWAPFRAEDYSLMGGMGCHYYVTQFKDQDMVQVDFMVSNAALTQAEIDADPVVASTQCVKHYYDTMSLGVNTGDGISADWAIYNPMPRASYLGGPIGMGEYEAISATENEIVTSQASLSNLFPPEAWSYRRHYYYLGETMSGQATMRGQWQHVGDAVGEYSYHTIPAYLGRAHFQPSLPRPAIFDDRDTFLQTELDYLTTAYAAGDGPGDPSQTLHADALGFFQPMLQKNDSAALAGGGWICPCIGWHQSPKELWASDLWTAGRIERHRKAQYDIVSGRILQVEDWLDGSNELKFMMSAVGNYTNWENDAFDRTIDTDETNCTYEVELYSYIYTAASHLSRTIMHPLLLSWSANDELCKDIVRTIASSTRHTCTHYDFNIPSASQPSFPYEESVNWMLSRADFSGHGWIYENTAQPGAISGGGAVYNHGVLSRVDAWMIDAMVNDYCLTPPDDPRRVYINDGMQAYAELIWGVGHNEAGLLTRGRGLSNSQGSVNANGIPHSQDYDLIHQFEHALIVQAMNSIIQRATLTGNMFENLIEIQHRNAYWMYIQTPYVLEDNPGFNLPILPHNVGVAHYTRAGTIASGILLPFHTCSGGYDSWHLHKVLPNYAETRGETSILQFTYSIHGTDNSGDYVDYQFDPTHLPGAVDTGEPWLQYSSHNVGLLQNGLVSFPYRTYG